MPDEEDELVSLDGVKSFAKNSHQLKQGIINIKQSMRH